MLPVLGTLWGKLAGAGIGLALVAGLIMFALMERSNAAAATAKLRAAQGQITALAKINARNLEVEQAKNRQLARAAAASLAFQDLTRKTDFTAAALGGQISQAPAVADQPAAPVLVQAFAGIGAPP
jgi:hypothetical protein